VRAGDQVRLYSPTGAVYVEDPEDGDLTVIYDPAGQAVGVVPAAAIKRVTWAQLAELAAAGTPIISAYGGGD
jgi:hypothetical protein